MTATNRLNLLLSEILQSESSSSSSSSSNNPIPHSSSTKPSTLLAFAEHDYSLPSITAAVSVTPHRLKSSLNNHNRQHAESVDQSNNETSFKKRPLLNSSTLDNLFHALTLECEQYLADSSTASYQNKIYGEFLAPPKTMPIHIDSNDDDYENLHTTNSSQTSDVSKLKTSIEVTSPKSRQIVSVNVSSSQTYPLLSTSILSSTNCCSSEDDNSMNISSSNTMNHKRQHQHRRRRARKQQSIVSTNRSSSSDDERTNTIDKKTSISKRSYSTDYRQQRIRSIYDNQPASTVTHKIPPRRIRRRDISLQQQSFSHASKYKGDLSLSLHENLSSPLSVLLTSTSDFVNRSQQRRSRSEYSHQQPISLLDRMHQQFYRTSPMHQQNNIPTHRLPSYPVY